MKSIRNYVILNLFLNGDCYKKIQLKVWLNGFIKKSNKTAVELFIHFFTKLPFWRYHCCQPSPEKKTQQKLYFVMLQPRQRGDQKRIDRCGSLTLNCILTLRTPFTLPSISGNIISLSKLYNGLFFFWHGILSIYKNNILIGSGFVCDDLNKLKLDPIFT